MHLRIVQLRLWNGEVDIRAVVPALVELALLEHVGRGAAIATSRGGARETAHVIQTLPAAVGPEGALAEQEVLTAHLRAGIGERSQRVRRRADRDGAGERRGAGAPRIQRREEGRDVI